MLLTVTNKKFAKRTVENYQYCNHSNYDRDYQRGIFFGLFEEKTESLPL